MATCKEQLKAVDQILDKVEEATEVETQLKILESSHNIFVDIAQSVEKEGGGNEARKSSSTCWKIDRTIIDCSYKMAHTLWTLKTQTWPAGPTRLCRRHWRLCSIVLAS